jgi:hypothetical protein
MKCWINRIGAQTCTVARIHVCARCPPYLTAHLTHVQYIAFLPYRVQTFKSTHVQYIAFLPYHVQTFKSFNASSVCAEAFGGIVCTEAFGGTVCAEAFGGIAHQV